MRMYGFKKSRSLNTFEKSCAHELVPKVRAATPVGIFDTGMRYFVSIFCTVFLYRISLSIPLGVHRVVIHATDNVNYRRDC